MLRLLPRVTFKWFSLATVRILSTLDREELKPNTSVALHRHSHAVVDLLPPESDSTVQVRAPLFFSSG